MSTVTIHTRDHGDVTIPEPAWCTGQFHQQGGARVDISHTSNDLDMAVHTSDGPAVLLRTVYEQRPYTERDPGRGVFVSVEINGDWYPSSPRDLDALAADLVEHAVKLRIIARQLAVMQHVEGS